MPVLARALLLSHHYVSVNYCWYCVVHPSQGTRTRVSAASEWIDSGSCFPRPSAGPLETRYALPGSDSHTRVARNVELDEFATFRALLQPGRVAIVRVAHQAGPNRQFWLFSRPILASRVPIYIVKKLVLFFQYSRKPGGLVGEFFGIS